MRSRSVLLVLLVLVLLLGLAGGVVAYDGSKKDTIAEGITVGGVDLGGLDERQARARLESELLPRLMAPVVVNHDKSTWTLGAKEAKISTNVGLLVNDAVRRSRDGGILGRTVRNLTGGEVDADLQPQVEFSKDAVVRLLDQVRRGIERPAKDATLRFTASGLQETDDQVGLRVKASELHRQIRAAIVQPGLERRFVAQTEKVEPKFTREELAKRNPVVLIADRTNFKLRVYRDLKLDKTYGIAVGAAGNETPTGLYKIANKAVNPAWSVPNSDWAGDLAGQVIPGGAPNNPLKSRWLGIYNGVGIHGTADRASIGSNASHGCLRMLVEDVEELYPRVPVGAPIYIAA